MAKDEKTSDDSEAGDGKKSGSNIKKIVLIAVAVLALVGVTVGGTMFMTGAFSKHEVTKGKKAKAKKPVDEEADAEASASEGDKGEDADKQANAEEEANPDGTPQVASYLDFDQPFVVNFQDEGQLRYVQIAVSVMIKDPKVAQSVKHHMPLIRNNLVMLFSGQTRETIISREGKEKIRKDAEAEVQKILKEQTGKPGIKSLYFTSFVMQ